METKTKSTFEILAAINVNEHVEKKNGLSYLSWAWAWHYVAKYFPDAFYTIYESPEGLNYFTDGRTAWVKTGVTIQGKQLIEYLPVMDYNNRSIPVDKLTSFDVNKAIQRSLTKACARHGLGLYIYAGEDLPEAMDDQKAETPQPKKKAAADPAKPEPPKRGTEMYKKCVAAIAEGKKDYKAFIEKFKPTLEYRDVLDADIETYRKTYNL